MATSALRSVTAKERRNAAEADRATLPAMSRIRALCRGRWIRTRSSRSLLSQVSRMGPANNVLQTVDLREMVRNPEPDKEG